MGRKLTLYLKCIWLNVVKNPIRFGLSLFGLFLSGFMLMAAVFFLDAYYNGCMAEVEEMPEDGAILTGVDAEKYTSFMNSVEGNYPQELTYLMDGNVTVYSSTYHDGMFFCNATLIGTSAQSTSSIYVESSAPHLASLTLVTGRLLTNEDVSNNRRVIVIDEYTAKLLYGDEDPLEQELTFYLGENAVSYTVVGVVESNYVTKTSYKQAANTTDVTDQAIVMETCLYVPITTLQEDAEDGTLESVLFWSGLTNAEIQNLDISVRNTLLSSYQDNLITLDSEINQVYQAMAAYKLLIFCLLFVIIVFTGLNSMTICFFATKERAAEIGIRKAYGASKGDIALQFTLEAVVISLIATSLALFFVTAFILKMLPFLDASMNMELIFRLKPMLILFPYSFLLLQGIVFSLIPSLYAASINVVDAIRFE